jgi:hypothetical protein
MPGIITSATIKSGLTSRTLDSASRPLSTDVILKSSVARTIAITLRMVSESSATSKLLGMRASK